MHYSLESYQVTYMENAGSKAGSRLPDPAIIGTVKGFHSPTRFIPL